MIRIVLFAGLLALLIVLGFEGWLAALLSAAIALCISYLFLGRLRGTVAQGVQDRRTGKTQAPHDDEDAEDALERNDFLKGDRPAQE